jgi:hypothetical protein
MKYDILKDTAVLVESQLDLLQAVHEVKKLQIEERSRIVCRCRSCREETRRALAWLEEVRKAA